MLASALAIYGVGNLMPVVPQSEIQVKFLEDMLKETVPRIWGKFEKP